MEDQNFATQQNNSDVEKIKRRENHVESVVFAAALMSVKITVFLILRFIISEFLLEQSPKPLIENDLVNLLIFIGYLFSVQVFLRRSKNYYVGSMTVLIGIINALELLMVLNTTFSPLFVATGITTCSFFALTFVLVKKEKNVVAGKLLVCAVLLFTTMFLILFMFYRGSIEKLKLAPIKFNLFLGAFFFCVWSVFFFAESENLETTPASCFSFAAVVESLSMIRKVLVQIKMESDSLKEDLTVETEKPLVV